MLLIALSYKHLCWEYVEPSKRDSNCLPFLFLQFPADDASKPLLQIFSRQVSMPFHSWFMQFHVIIMVGVQVALTELSFCQAVSIMNVYYEVLEKTFTDKQVIAFICLLSN
jgi:hypothetical protein